MDKDRIELAEKYVTDDDIWLFNTGSAQRAYDAFACKYLPEADLTRFAVWAPNAREVSVVGDFNGWDGAAAPMAKLNGGVRFSPRSEAGRHI